MHECCADPEFRRQIKWLLAAVVVLFSLGEHIRRRRRATGLTQEDLADKIGVDRTTVGRWERGEAVPEPLSLRRLMHHRLIDRAALPELLAGGTADRRYEYVVPIVAPRDLIAASCRFGLLHIRTGTGEHNPAINNPIDFVPFGDRGELRAAVRTPGNVGFEFKCFVDFRDPTFAAVRKSLEDAGFREVTLGEGKIQRAWFLLRDYRVVQEKRTQIRNNVYFPE